MKYVDRYWKDSRFIYFRNKKLTLEECKEILLKVKDKFKLDRPVLLVKNPGIEQANFKGGKDKEGKEFSIIEIGKEYEKEMNLCSLFHETAHLMAAKVDVYDHSRIFQEIEETIHRWYYYEVEKNLK